MIKKIKQKLNNVWKWAVVVIIGGVVLAAIIAFPNVNFENLPKEYVYQNEVTSECSSKICWTNDEGKKECTATFGKCQWINDEGTWKDFTDVVGMSFDNNSGNFTYSYKEDYSVIVRLFFVVDVPQNICEIQGWNWRSQDGACFLWWDKAKEFMEVNGISYDAVIAKNPSYYKYALTLNGIPQVYQDKLLYVGLHLEEANGLTWDDIKKQEHSLIIKDKIKLGFDDLLNSGYTLNLYDTRTVLIGNVKDKENLYLDPIAEPTGETSDGYIAGEDSVYATALSTSYGFSIADSYLYLGQDYATACSGTADICDDFDNNESGCGGQSGCDWSSTVGECAGTPIYSCGDFYNEVNCEDVYVGCTWDGYCTGTINDCAWYGYPNGNEGFCNYFCGVGAWSGCSGTATSCDSFNSDESGCGGQSGCTWGETFDVYRTYLDFDTSAIPDDATITDVSLSLKASSDYSDVDFDVRIYKYAWTEPIDSGSREANYDASGATYDADWRNTSGMSTGIYYDSPSLDNSWVNLTGDTKYQLRSSRDVNANTPSGDEYIKSYSANAAGNEPILKVTYAYEEIDIGPGATDEAVALVGGYTYIEITNPANATGILTSIEIWANIDLTGCKVGTFSGTGTSYTPRDVVTIGNVTSGSKQTFTEDSESAPIAIDVETGDFIGIYWATGGKVDGKAGVNHYYKSGDQFAAGEQTYTAENYILSIYGTGEGPVVGERRIIIIE